MLLLPLLLPGCGKFRKKSTFEPGGEWAPTMREKIQETVTDPDRSSRMLAVVDSVDADVKRLDKQVQGFYAEFSRLDSNAESRREEFDDLMSRFNAALGAFRERYVESLFEIKGQATREEWKKLSDIDKTLYEQWQRPFERRSTPIATPSRTRSPTRSAASRSSTPRKRRKR
jgi:hypothetical protein